jgi:predicted small secreted protein
MYCFMHQFRVAASLILLCWVLAACAESDSGSGEPIHRPFDFNYGTYGSSGGYVNPNACWRSSSPADCHR